MADDLTDYDRAMLVLHDQLNSTYRERNALVQLAASMAEALGMRIGVGYDEDEPDEDWPILFIELPCGQASWHIPRKELFAGFLDVEFPYKWDGHTTKEKYERVECYVEHGDQCLHKWGTVDE